MSGSLTGKYNAVGAILLYTRSPTYLVVGTGLSVSILGTNEDDALMSYGGGSILDGGLGDDTYYIWDRTDQVIEAVGIGIDTVMFYDWQYTLPNNVENLVLGSDGSYGIGNALDNIITGENGAQTIDGAAGNDVLAGGAGSDTFLFTRGSGKDLISDFEVGVDRVSFDATLSQFTSLASVTAAMAQSGADVVLNLGANDSITFSNQLISDFVASDFVLAPNLAAMRQTFGDEFMTFNASPTGYTATMSNTVWQTAYEFYQGYTTRTLAPGSPETGYYSDSSVGVNPFTNIGGTLAITAAPAAAGTVPDGLTYTSGVITTQTSFSQPYGYFEMRAQLPAGQGFWPAFWLVRDDGVWPPEIDVFEASSNDPEHLLGGVMTQETAGVTTGTHLTYHPNLTTGMHTYGLSWRPDMMRFYVDGREIAATHTPADMNKPMYMIASLAVGDQSVWPGPPDGTSSGTMTIDYIRAYQFRDIAPYLPTAPTMKVLTGTIGADTLVGGAGNDRIEGGRGNDMLTGGAGSDTFILTDLSGLDTITDFQATQDKVVISGFNSAQVTMQFLASGTQISFGTNKVLLAGVWWFGPNDIVSGATTTNGTTKAEAIDRSAIVTPTASIYGLAGADTIKGGAGADWIAGGAGNDILTGNAGRDMFHFSAGSGQDVIADFIPGIDTLVLQRATQASLQAAWANVSGIDGIQLNYGTLGDSVFLSGVTSLQDNSIILA